MKVHYFTRLNNTRYRKINDPELYARRWQWLVDNIQLPALHLANRHDPWELRADWAALYNEEPAGRRHFQPNLIITHTAQLPRAVMHTTSRDQDADRDGIFHAYLGIKHLMVVNLMPNLRDIYVIDRREAEYLSDQLGAEIIHIPGFEGDDGRRSNHKRLSMGFDNVYDRRKAYNMLNLARQGYYDDATNAQLIALEESGQRQEFMTLPLWDEVRVHGYPPKNPRKSTDNG